MGHCHTGQWFSTTTEITYTSSPVAFLEVSSFKLTLQCGQVLDSNYCKREGGFKVAVPLIALATPRCAETSVL
jgi:hypothetical protein